MKIGGTSNVINQAYNQKIAKMAEEAAQLPEEIINQKMQFDKKMIKANTVAKVLGLGNIIDTYA